MQHIDHLGIAVLDLPAAEALYSKLLNADVYRRETVEREGVATSFLRVGQSDTKVELLGSLSEDSPVGKFLAKRGEGLHHVAFECQDIRAEMARLQGEGFTLLSPEPKLGAEGKWVCFLHPKGTGGLLVELVQTPPTPGQLP